MNRLTKTFVENRWYRQVSPGKFDMIPREETKEGPALDDQVQQWVKETGNLIVHPGQLGMHTAWHGDKTNPYQLKCVSLGLTVLYVEPEDDRKQSTAASNPSPAAPALTGPGLDPIDVGSPGGSGVSTRDTAAGSPDAGGGSGDADDGRQPAG